MTPNVKLRHKKLYFYLIINNVSRRNQVPEYFQQLTVHENRQDIKNISKNAHKSRIFPSIIINQ
jgi:hypothetical protein